MHRTPAQVRAELIPEDRPAFDTEWREAMASASESLSLAPVEEMLDRWRKAAWMVNGDPERYRARMAWVADVQAAYASGEPAEAIHRRFDLRPAPTAEEILAARGERA